MRILVVDDNPDVAMSLAELLKIDGWDDVAVAHDGAAAIESMTARIPDLVICDLGLPGEMDGLGLARVCRSTPGFERVRLVAMSGYGGDEYRNQAVAAGFDDLLVKPVRYQALGDLVRGSPTTG
jgi:CheY-like chemotaxis protein